MRDHILITGGNGFIGAAVASRLLEATPHSIVLPVRRLGRDPARRARDALEFFLGPDRADALQTRFHVVPGDVTKPGLGLDSDALRAASRDVTAIVHSAGDVRWHAPAADSLATNLHGTARVLDFARQCRRLRRLIHVSTAFVCGRRTGTIAEDDLDSSHGFHNPYEASKCEAELLLRSHPDVPITVVRPSAVVGDSRTGRTSAFNVVYFPIKAIYHGVLTVIPGPANATVEMVPIDYVAKAIVHLLEESSPRGTFHLTASGGTVGELAAAAVEFFNAHRGPRDRLSRIRFVPRWLYRGLYRPVSALRSNDVRAGALEMLEQYDPYLCADRRFLATSAEAVLGAAGIRPAPMSDYLTTLLSYCLASNWGRRNTPLDACAAARASEIYRHAVQRPA